MIKITYNINIPSQELKSYDMMYQLSKILEYDKLCESIESDITYFRNLDEKIKSNKFNLWNKNTIKIDCIIYTKKINIINADVEKLCMDKIDQDINDALFEGDIR